MANTKLNPLTAYGTDEDKRKLKELARRDGKTDSKWIIDQVRREHERLFDERVIPECRT